MASCVGELCRAHPAEVPCRQENNTPPTPAQICYGTPGGLRWIFDLGRLAVGDRPFKFRNGPEGGEVFPAGGPLVVMNGQAAGWQGDGKGSTIMHGRAGQGVSIVVDVVPKQDKGAGRAGEGLGLITQRGVAKFFDYQGKGKGKGKGI